MRYSLIVITTVLGFSKFVYSFDNELTHTAITEEAVFSSLLDDYLKNEMHLGEGIRYELDVISCSTLAGRIYDWMTTKRTVLEWLREG